MIIHPFGALLIPLAVALSIQAAPLLSDIKGQVVGVHDGDTLTLLTADKTQVKVRLEGIDAPESSQAFGAKAKQALSNLVFGRQITVKDRGQDRYGRTLGRVFVGALDVNLVMVRIGFAWRYDQYSKEAALLEAQHQAKARGLGLWADPEPIPPWEWRRK